MRLPATLRRLHPWCVDTRPPGRRLSCDPATWCRTPDYRSTREYAIVSQSTRSPTRTSMELRGLATHHTPAHGRGPASIGARTDRTLWQPETRWPTRSWSRRKTSVCVHRRPCTGFQVSPRRRSWPHASITSPSHRASPGRRCRILDVGFPVPRSPVPVTDSLGTSIRRLDMAYENVRVGAEYDGREFHTPTHDRGTGPRSAEPTSRRRRRLALQPRDVRARVRHLTRVGLRARRADPAPRPSLATWY